MVGGALLLAQAQTQVIHGPAAPESWWHVFRPYSPTHLSVLAVALAVCTTLCVVARRGKERGTPDRIARVWGAFIFPWQTAEVIFYLSDWSIQRSLPLQLCDLASWVAGLSLFTKHPFWRTMLYFWGLGLSTQAFFTPIVEVGPAHPRFWFYWTGHSHIVLGALYEIIARGYRPTWRSFLVAVGGTAAWYAFVIVFNLIFDTNYGFAGRSRPGAATIVDALGPWPLRLVWMGLLVAAAYAVLTLIWPRNWPRRRGSA